VSSIAVERDRRPGADSRRLRLTLALLALAQLIISLDLTIVYVALPDIARGLHFSAQTLQLVVSAYAVGFGGFLLLGGRVSDLFGRRRMFVLGLLLYGTASLIGGLAGTAEVLVGARALQGIGGAVLFPATLSLVHTIFAEGAQRNRALGVWAGAGAGGMVAGVLLGGVLTQAFGWAAVFFVNVPFAAVAAVLAFALVRPDGPRLAGRTLDAPGALTATIGMTLVLYALVQGPGRGWDEVDVLGAIAAGIAALAGFLAIETRSRDPLLPPRLLRIRNVRLGVTITFLFMATFGTLLYFLTVYFQQVQGFTALRTGVACLVPMGAVFIGSNAGGHLMSKFGLGTTLTASLGLGLAGMLGLAACLRADASYLALVPGLAVLSVGQGVAFPTMFAVAATGVSDAEQGVASGLASSGQQVGSAIGLAILVAIANSNVDEHLQGTALHDAIADGLRTALLVAAGGVALTVVAARRLRLPRDHR
jgi:EmrB/QacA subfamily drug resistance transporter